MFDKVLNTLLHKSDQTTEGKDTQHGNFKARYIRVLNHRKNFETTLKLKQTT